MFAAARGDLDLSISSLPGMSVPCSISAGACSAPCPKPKTPARTPSSRPGPMQSFKGGAVRPWLFRIATNTCYDVLRSKGRKPTGSLDALEFETEPDWSTQSDPVDPVRFAETGDLSRMLETALAQIPDEQRLAVTLCDIQGLRSPKPPQVMETSLGTVKSRLFRGRAKLRDLLVASPAGGNFSSQESVPLPEKANDDADQRTTATNRPKNT